MTHNIVYFQHIIGPMLDYKTKLTYMEGRAKLGTLDTLKQLRSRASFAGIFMHLENYSSKSYEQANLKD